MIGQSYIVRPNIKLPFDQAQNAAMHASRVDAHTHVHIHGHYLAHQTVKRRDGEKGKERENIQKGICSCNTTTTQYALLLYSRYGVYHIESHLNSAVGMIRPRLWQTGDAVIAIAQQLYAQTMMLCSQTVKAAIN